MGRRKSRFDSRYGNASGVDFQRAIRSAGISLKSGGVDPAQDGRIAV
jgi:hypothetical protein